MTEKQIQAYQKASKEIWHKSRTLEELKANMLAFEKQFLSEVKINEC